MRTGVLNSALFVGLFALLLVHAQTGAVYAQDSQGMGAAREESLCLDLMVDGGGQRAPTTVSFETEVVGGLNVVRYRYHFGDGTVEDGEKQTTHEYVSGGEYQAFVEVLTDKGEWVTSEYCEETVSLGTSLLEQHRAACSEVVIVEGQDATPSATVVMEVRGYDNQGEIQQYRLDFGDGAEAENESGRFEHSYGTAGTYTVVGEVQDSRGNWRGAKDACTASVRVLTQPLEKQPETGAELWVVLMTFGSGFLGMVMLVKQSSYAHV